MAAHKNSRKKRKERRAAERTTLARHPATAPVLTLASTAPAAARADGATPKKQHAGGGSIVVEPPPPPVLKIVRDGPELDERDLPHSKAAIVVPQPLSKQPEWKERVIRTFAVLTLAYSLYYIVWRWTSTLNWDAWWFSVTLAFAETVGLLTTFFFVFNTWKMKHHRLAPPRAGITVDVFVTTYDEPLEVIRKTALGAREIRYPHKTWILDDGKRAELMAMCEELGIGYIRREGNENAKAGNLNHALKHTTGDVFLVFDADHVPLPQAVDRLLPYFEDPKVAFVQSPQVFYNTDSITAHVQEDNRRLWTEQNLFFTVIEPCKDHWGAAFFCGSCAALRREALEEIGGFSTKTITEDFETSVILHGRGWKSAYCNETLAYGLAPNSVVGFHVQHLRWGQGTMQVWRHFNPLTYPGLTLGQRLCHFYSVLVYTDGVLNLLFYSAPLVYLLFGVLPINTLGANFLGRWIPLYVAGRILSRLMARGTETPYWFNERNSMAKFWTHARAVTGYFAKKKLKFHVTPKGTGEVPVEAYRPQLVMMGLSGLAIVWGLVAYHMGWVSYGAPGQEAVPFWLNIFWASWIFAMAAWVVRLSRNMQPKRADHRFPEALPIRFRMIGADGAAGEADLALTQDLNSAGMAFRSTHALPEEAALEFEIPLVGGPVRVRGTLLHSYRSLVRGVPLWVHGVRFDDVPLDVRDAIEVHCTQQAVPHARIVYRESMDVFEQARIRLMNRRGSRRILMQLPVMVSVAENGAPWERAEERIGVLDDTSAGGASIVLDVPVTPGARVRFASPGTGVSGEGVVVYTQPLETPVGVRFSVGLERAAGAAWPVSRNGVNGEGWMRKVAILAGSAVGLRRLVTTFVVGVGVAAGAPAAEAQSISYTVYGGVALDGYDTNIQIVGATVRPAGEGFRPMGGLQAYRLGYEVADEGTDVYAVTPMVGAGYFTADGAVNAMVGYALVSDEAPGAFFGGGGGESGVTTSVQGLYWGATPDVEAIASYSWGPEYLWTNALVAQPIATTASGTFSVGVDGVWEGQMVDDGFRAYSIGPLVRWSNDRNLGVTLAGGYRDADDRDSTWYVRLGAAFYQ